MTVDPTDDHTPGPAPERDEAPTGAGGFVAPDGSGQVPTPPPLSALPPPTPGGPTAPGGDGGWSGGRRIPLRPLALGEILDAAVRLYRGTFQQVALLVLIALGAITILNSFVAPAMPGMFDDPASFEATFEDPFAFGLRYGLFVLLTIAVQLFVYPLVRGGVTGIALAADRGGDASWQAGLRLAWTLAGRLLGLAFLLLFAGLAATVVGGLALALPVLAISQVSTVLAVLFGVVAVVVFLAATLAAVALIRLSVPVVVVEHLGPTAALRRSYELVRPQLLRVVGIVFVTGLLLGIVGGVFGVLTVPFSIFGGRVAQLGTALITTLGLVVTVPLEANVGLLLYVDSRVRMEGLDVAVLTAELDNA